MFTENILGCNDDVTESSVTLVDYSRYDFCDGELSPKTDAGKESKVTKIKTIELILAAVYTLISAALSVVKFINQIGKIRNAAA